jgi:glycosyltransferase involved in cell wall biosynthesis
VQVFGYAHRCHWRARRWARRQRVPLLLVSDSSLAIRPSWWKRPLKAVVVRWFYRAVDGALAVGAQNRAYHRHYGLPEARLYSGCLPVDRARLQAAVPDRDAARALVRERHGIPKDAFVVLLCAKYVARKRPCDLVAAARAAASRGLPIWALLVGEGPLRPRLERLCRAPGAGGAVLTGFINQSTLPSYYAAADVVALPAEREPYGLAITEGGCFGLPAIVSDQVGCVGLEDAARPGVNALVHRCGDRDQLEHAIVSLAADRRRYAAMAAAAARIAAERDAAGAAAALAAAATALARLGPRRADGFGSRP